MPYQIVPPYVILFVPENPPIMILMHTTPTMTEIVESNVVAQGVDGEWWYRMLNAAAARAINVRNLTFYTLEEAKRTYDLLAHPKPSICNDRYVLPS